MSSVAVIGLAYRFPGMVDSAGALWDALINRRDLIENIPADRWATERYQHPTPATPGRARTYSAGVLHDLFSHDTAFFGLSPREATALDPQQRLMLTLAWEAFEDAGIPPSSLAGSDTSVHIGISGLDHGMRVLDDLAGMTAHTMTGNTMSIAANRLSYFFDLHGASLAVDTACSSSLAALHLGCEGLRHGSAQVALVGGVNVLLHPYPFVGFSQANMLSPRGRCHSFDAAADGYVRSEGAAIAVLKRLEDAERDGDAIHAVIRASGVNADGHRKNGLTIPSREGQIELMQGVLERAGLSAGEIDFAEAHGTGTPVGDPIECSAIGEVYGRNRDRPLPIGSVKSNLGHLECASGMAGLAKAILALQHRKLPPSIHFDKPNPEIDFDGLGLVVARDEVELSAVARPLRAVVNSFGFGGLNASVLLESWSKRQLVTKKPSRCQPPLLLSAASETALKALADRYALLLERSPPENFYDIAWGAAHGRDALGHRLLLRPSQEQGPAEALSLFARGETAPAVCTEKATGPLGLTAFIFSGNGAQYWGMGRRLLEQSPRFREILQALDPQIAALAGFSVLEELAAAQENSRLDDTAVAQPALFAMQVGLTTLLNDAGVHPDACTGHSVGEIAAAWCSGALTLDQAIRVIVARSQAQSLTRGSGRMLAARLGAEAARALIDEGQLDVEVAAINSPGDVTLAGPLEELEKLQKLLDRQGTLNTLLDLDYAFHSHAMDGLRDELVDVLAGLTPSAPGKLFVSTVSGTKLPGTELTSEYWWDNIRKPVRFDAAVRTLADSGARLFIEVTPHAILQRFIGDNLRACDVRGQVLATSRRDSDDLTQVETIASKALLFGAPQSLSQFFPVEGAPVKLPHYPWERTEQRQTPTSESAGVIQRERIHPLLGWTRGDEGCAWENTIDSGDCGFIADHRIGGGIVFPAAGFIELALAAARERFADEGYELEELEIRTALLLNEHEARTLRFDLDDGDGRFRVRSRVRLSDDPWMTHAEGRVLRSAGARLEMQHIPAAQGQTTNEFPCTIEAAEHYALAQSVGLDYGPAFRGLSRYDLTGHRVHGEITITPEIAGELQTHVLHPAIVDLAFQSLVGCFRENISRAQGTAMLPIKAGRVRLHSHHTPVSFTGEVRYATARTAVADFTFQDAAGCPIATFEGCRFRAVTLNRAESSKPAIWSSVLRPRPRRCATHRPLQVASESLLAVARASLADDPVTTTKSRGWQSAQPLLEAFVLTLSQEAFPTVFTVNAQRGDVDGVPPYPPDCMEVPETPLVRWLVQKLIDEGIAIDDGSFYRLVRDDSLPAASVLWRLLLDDYPTLQPLLSVLASTRIALRELLCGALSPESYAEQIAAHAQLGELHALPMLTGGTERALGAIVGELRQSFQPGQVFRVLELSGYPSTLAEQLQPLISTHQVHFAHAAVNETAHHRNFSHENFSTYRFDDTACQLQPALGELEKFDLICLNHSLHSMADPAGTLAAMRDRLRSGGRVLIAERHTDAASDLIHGAADLWWRDANDRIESSLAPPDAWSALLKNVLFEDIAVIQPESFDGIAAGPYLLTAVPENTSGERETAHETASWIFVTPDKDTALDSANALADELRVYNQKCVVLPAHGRNLEEIVVSLQQQPEALEAADHIVFLAALAREDDNDETHVAPRALALNNTALAIARTQRGRAAGVARLWVVTSGGCAADANSAVEHQPEQGALWSFCRVLGNERPEHDLTLVDVTAGLNAAGDAIPALVDELLTPDEEREIVLGAEGRSAVRIEPQQDANSSNASGGKTSEPETNADFQLDFSQAGSLDNLRWSRAELRALGPKDVEVDVSAAGLNFRDVMQVMGLVPDEMLEGGFSGPSLGLELAGTVTTVGSEISHLAQGDRVMGFASGCFANRVITNENALIPIPGDWSFAEAATVPTVFLTAYYALVHLARLRQGERVLIHAAAGGVGLAAIQIAQHLEAEVFVTAGTPEKRAFLEMLGIEHIFDSRTLEFADEILAATSGEGVDVVLNSLSGEAINANLRILRRFGRFLELGKRDYAENTRIGLRPLRHNISYFGIDADQLLVDQPELASQLLVDVMALFADGTLTPLPLRTFAARHAVEAFRYAQQARHVGKIVLTLDPPPALEHTREPVKTLGLRSDRSYLVTGGTTGFGLKAARWLASRGARNLVLIGRRGSATPGLTEALERLRLQNVNTFVTAADVSDRQAMSQALESAMAELPPLAGVVHAAAVYDDAPTSELDTQRMRAVLEPKAAGAWNLHHLTLGFQLDFFVLFSSVSNLLGNPGQASYTAANGFLESLACLRQAQKLPATAVAWGPIADTGYLARNEQVQQLLESNIGAQAFNAEVALDCLDEILTRGQTVVTIADIAFQKLESRLLTARTPRFAALRALAAEGGLRETLTQSSLIALLHDAPDSFDTALRSMIIEEVAGVLGLDPETIDCARPLHDMGLDSLMGIEFALGLEQRFQITLPPLLLANSPDVEKLTSALSLQVRRAAGLVDEDHADPAAAELGAMAKRHGVALTDVEIEEIRTDLESSLRLGRPEQVSD